MCTQQRRQCLRIFVTLTILISTAVVNTGHLCFLGYWVRSEVNEDIPQTPGFSIHLLTNGVLAVFTVISIALHVKMAYMVHRGALAKSQYSCVSHTNTFVVMTFLLFASIATFLYVKFPLYRLSAPFPPRIMNPNRTGKELFNIPMWLDKFQTKFHCCGGDSYVDYKYMVHNAKGMERLPKSCCKKFQATHADHRFACEVDAFSMVPASAHFAIHTEGCQKKLERHFKLLTEITMYFCWVIFGLSFVSMLAFRHEFKRSRSKRLDEESSVANKYSSQIIGASGENSATSVHHEQVSADGTTVRIKVAKESKPELYTKGYNPAIPQLFGSSNNNNNNNVVHIGGIGAVGTQHRPRKLRRPVAPTNVQQKRSQSHPYDYFSRHGLSNVL